MERAMLLNLLLLALVASATAQLAPVYNPGGTPEPVVVEATPTAEAPTERPAAAAEYVTKTVYGFLDFTTTVGSTVMIFTPQSQSAKPKPSKTRDPVLPSRLNRPSSRITLRPTPTPTPTIPKVTATPAPSVLPSKLPAISSSSTLQSSFFEDHTALDIETLFDVSPDEEIAIDYDAEYPEYEEPVFEEVIEEVKEEARKPTAAPTRPKPFRRFKSSSSQEQGNRRRLDLNYFNSRKKTPSLRRQTGGSTIVPITIEGTGTFAPKSTSVIRPTVVPTTPSEVVVSATQGFATLSVIGPFSTAINNELGQVKEHYDFLSSAPVLDVEETYDVYDVEPTASLEDLYSSGLVTSDSSFPTGLVTKLGGTIVSDGLITVHETSVIGTYIAGQYAQILQSTSHIFQTTPVPEISLNSPSLPEDYETVKSVIKGSATQFLSPESTASLPLESLFSEPSSRERNSRKDEEGGSAIQVRLREALAKRLGSSQSQNTRQDRSRLAQDPYVDEEKDEFDLKLSGSDLRPSFGFRGSTPVTRTPRVSTLYAEEVKPTTYRPRFKPTSTRRFGSSRPTSVRSPPNAPFRQTRPANRWRLNTSPRPKVNINRRPVNQPDTYDDLQAADESQSISRPTAPEPIIPEGGEETLRIVTSTPADGATDVWFEVATIRSLHTFRVGTTKNTRYVTFTKTTTHSIDPTPAPLGPQDDLYETPLFENILDDGPRDVSTLPPVDLGESDVTALLETVTETFSTTELMKKTSILPVLHAGETSFYTLTQTYHITRVVTALKTMPPYEAFSFIPENSLNEFNGQLLAEGTENDESLLPGEIEYDENGEIVDTTSGTRVPPPPGFPFQDPNLAELAGGQFNPDVFEKQLHPQLTAALQHRQQMQQKQGSAARPQLSSGQLAAPGDPAIATPSLTAEQLQQLAYLRLINPYGFGGFPPVQQQQQTTVTSSPVTITTDITTTSTRVLRVIFNARPIFTTISSVEVVHTTITSFETATVTVAPTLPSFPFPFPGSPFPVG